MKKHSLLCEILNYPTIELLVKKVNPPRFLWHVKHAGRSSDLNIARFGLLKPKDYAVFAHNQLENFNDMYPYFMDSRDFETEVTGAEFYDYSFWRIDTQIANVPWFIDPYCEDEPFIASPIHYLCTPNSIPKEALKLFNFDLDNYLKKEPKFKLKNGVAHIYGIRTDFDTLVPNPLYETIARKLLVIQHCREKQS